MNKKADSYESAIFYPSAPFSATLNVVANSALPFEENPETRRSPRIAAVMMIFPFS
ncbi:hypothetical protein QKW52_25805 [Bacillus sonorensis]|nr:hypothetical protein [Bacillus sonorensis]